MVERNVDGPLRKGQKLALSGESPPAERRGIETKARPGCSGFDPSGTPVTAIPPLSVRAVALCPADRPLAPAFPVIRATAPTVAGRRRRVTRGRASVLPAPTGPRARHHLGRAQA